MIEDWFTNTIDWQAPVGDPTTTDASAGPIYEPYEPQIISDPCRVDPMTATQLLAWGVPVQQLGWVVYTKQAGISKGWVGTLDDSRILRVLGTKQLYAINDLDSYYEVYTSEIKSQTG